MSLANRPALGSKLTVFGAWVCPFVHRVVLSLKKKIVAYDWIEINLQDKPSWYPEVNPAGKVPAVGYKDDGGEYIVTESLTILEFLEDYQPESSLLPKHPALRARSRNIINAYNEKVVPLWYQVVRSPDKDACVQAASNFTKELQQIQSLMDPQGPYFVGQEFTNVDAALLPWLVRLPVLKYYRGYELPEELQKLSEYISFCKTQPWLQATFLRPEGKDFDSAVVEAYTSYGKEPVNYFTAAA